MRRPTFGVCACGHGKHMHEGTGPSEGPDRGRRVKANNERAACSLYRCGCQRYDERERYEMHAVRREAS